MSDYSSNYTEPYTMEPGPTRALNARAAGIVIAALEAFAGDCFDAGDDDGNRYALTLAEAFTTHDAVMVPGPDADDWRKP